MVLIRICRTRTREAFYSLRTTNQDERSSLVGIYLLFRGIGVQKIMAVHSGVGVQKKMASLNVREEQGTSLRSTS
jgi:hypothetical protein